MNNPLTTKRKKENLSRCKLAEILDVTEKQVARWERGDSFPRPCHQVIFVRLFGADFVGQWLEYWK